MLIDEGADASARDNYDLTPLDYAGDPRMAGMLRDHGAICTNC